MKTLLAADDEEPNRGLPALHDMERDAWRDAAIELLSLLRSRIRAEDQTADAYAYGLGAVAVMEHQLRMLGVRLSRPKPPTIFEPMPGEPQAWALQWALHPGSTEGEHARRMLALLRYAQHSVLALRSLAALGCAATPVLTGLDDTCAAIRQAATNLLVDNREAATD